VTFPANIYLLAFASALLASAASLPVWRAWCQRTGHVDDPGHRKIHTEPTPLAGGLAVATGLLLPVLFGVGALLLGSFSAATAEPLRYGLGVRTLPLLAIFAGAAGMVALGWLDDRHELSAGPKFGGQFLIALLVAAAGVRVTLFVPNLVFSYAVTILWILTVTNAFNFMDNMNGLCTGLGVIAAAWFAVNAAWLGQYLVAALAFLTAGAVLGFLPFNYPRARAFLGDAGSQLVGYLLAVLAILPHFHTPEHPRPLAVLTPLLVLAVPLGDLAWVVVLRTLARQPFWIGDTNHLSHRLVRRGLTKPQAVLAIWLLAAVLGALSRV
jgi:UDP-GlcNAc:undecaprenyl-phosphate GlcNAc-1-phosphate transferase